MLEVIAMTVDDAIKIENCGADRIELVSALTEGGLTPSYGLIESVINKVDIPVNVMIRPHANSFVYTDDEIELMIKDIKIAKDLGANGVVLGVLTDDGEINEPALTTLLKAASGIDVTFHRAIDETTIEKSIKTLNKLGVTTTLTSGGVGNVSINKDKLKGIVDSSNSTKILLGGGVTLENIEEIQKLSTATDFHVGTTVRIDKSAFKVIDEDRLNKLVTIVKGFNE